MSQEVQTRRGKATRVAPEVSTVGLPKVAFLLPGTDTGGMERFLLNLLPHVMARANVHVHVTGGRPGRLHKAFEDTRAPLSYRRLGTLGVPGGRYYRRLFQRERYDVVCDLSGIFAATTLTLARLAGVPRRIAFHRRSTYAFDPTLARRSAAWVLRKGVEQNATHILANSRTALQAFHPSLVENDVRLDVHRNVIEPAALRPSRPRNQTREALQIPEDAEVLLTLGRNRPSKDYPTLLRALSTALRQYPELHAVIAGPETEHLDPSRFGVRREDEERIHLLGNRSDVPNLLGAADFFVFPSRTEGMPNALLEAMVVGLPVVTTDIPPIREIMPQDALGHLIPPGDSAALAEVLRLLIRDSAERGRRTYREHARALTEPGRVLPPLLGLLAPTSEAGA